MMIENQLFDLKKEHEELKKENEKLKQMIRELTEDLYLEIGCLRESIETLQGGS